MYILLVILFLLVLGIIGYNYYRFSSSSYEKKSGNGFLTTMLNKGIYGEFLIFTKLENVKIPKILMTNLYIPKADGKTTELDLIMLTQKGIFVFESKNYSGWIFGNEKDYKWTQTFQGGKKFQFYNPIKQNRGHIDALKEVSGLPNEECYISYIVFGPESTLKDITVVSKNVEVMKKQHILYYLKKDWQMRPTILNKEQLQSLYKNLERYHLASSAQKTLHVNQFTVKK